MAWKLNLSARTETFQLVLRLKLQILPSYFFHAKPKVVSALAISWQLYFSSRDDCAAFLPGESLSASVSAMLYHECCQEDEDSLEVKHAP